MMTIARKQEDTRWCSELHGYYSTDDEIEENHEYYSMDGKAEENLIIDDVFNTM